MDNVFLDPGATSCTRKKPGPIDPAEIPESNPPSCINVDENPVDNDDGSSTVSAPFLEYIDDDDEIYQSGMKPCIVLDDPDEPENIPVKMEEDECLFEFEDAEEMPTASGSHLNEPGIKSTKPGRLFTDIKLFKFKYIFTFFGKSSCLNLNYEKSGVISKT